MATKSPSAPRCAAIVGPYLSGKTTLLESFASASGAIGRKGSVNDGNTVGDWSPEARAHQMSVELSIATTEYLGEQWTFVDCPGSIELVQDSMVASLVADAAILVCEPGPEKALAAARMLRVLDERSIPYLIFINKAENPDARIRETLEALQDLSERPMVLREVPIREGEAITGFVDLVSERAYKWNEDKRSDLIEVPAEIADREQTERTNLLESLADFNDAMLEQLLEDVVPPTEEVYDNLARDFGEGLIVPVFFGSALHDHGITRLLKALRHEVPGPDATAVRLGFDGAGEAVAQVFKTMNGAQSGKLSAVRVFGGEIADGATLNGCRISGMFKLFGQKQDKVAKAGTGEVVALGRMEDITTGTALSASGKVAGPDWPAPPAPVYALAIRAEKREDEVKMTGALAKIVEEDPSLVFAPNPDTHEMVVRGQGDTHIKLALERMQNRNKLEINSKLPQVAYKETIRKSISQHARHKKQSGGHGQFGDVHVEIKPLPRGGGFEFSDSITGGVVPKQYIPAVENGIKEYLDRGPLGFPVVDVAVELTDGQYHSVDSSDQAFKTAGALAMREGMPKCDPVLLEPIFHVLVSVPSEFTSRVQRLISGRRGQILGFEPKEGWKGWDEVSVQLPESETLDLINELRSLSQGLGSFEMSFDRLQEFAGREAEQVVAARAEAN